MNLDDRITDIVESGQNAARSKTYQLLSDMLTAVSQQYAIPVGELLDAVKDEM